MTHVLTVDLRGESIPLTDCTWLQVAPCGCACGAVIAAYRDRVYATAASAALAISGGDLTQVREDDAQGFTWELIGTDDARTRLGGCTHRPRWGVGS